MMQSFKYGIIATVGYMIILTVVLALTAWIDGNGISGLHGLITPFNIVLTTIGGIVVFIAGYCFPHIFSHMVEDYKSEYPDIPEKYVVEICRGKLMKKCSYNLAIGCFFIGLFISMDKKPPIIAYYLIFHNRIYLL